MGFWEPLFFWIFAFGALATSCAVIVMRNPLYCALTLIADFFCFAGLYVLLSAHFLAVVQILVYGGAIMVLFLFIIMLLNLRGKNLEPNRFQIHYVLASIAGVLMFVFAGWAIFSAVDMETVAEERAQYAECVEVVEEAAETEAVDDAEYGACVALVGEPDEWVPHRVDSQIPNLSADASEEAVEEEYVHRLRQWKAGTATPAEGKYPSFDPDRTFELPPSLEPDPEPADVVPGREGLYGTFKPVSMMLVNRFVIPFELTAILLLASIVGAVILAKRRVT